MVEFLSNFASLEGIALFISTLAVLFTAIPALIMWIRRRGRATLYSDSYEYSAPASPTTAELPQMAAEASVAIRRHPRSSVTAVSPKTEVLVSPTGNIAFLVEPNVGRSFPIHDGMNIGRALDNDLTLDDEKVSAEHARIRYRDGAYYIYDLATVNGIFVNGKLIRARSILYDDDMIAIGDQEFLVKIAS